MQLLRVHFPDGFSVGGVHFVFLRGPHFWEEISNDDK